MFIHVFRGQLHSDIKQVKPSYKLITFGQKCKNQCVVLCMYVCMQFVCVCCHLMQSEHSMSPLSNSSAGTILPPHTAAVWKLLVSSAQNIIIASAHMFLCVCSRYTWSTEETGQISTLSRSRIIKKKERNESRLTLQCVCRFIYLKYSVNKC